MGNRRRRTAVRCRTTARWVSAWTAILRRATACPGIAYRGTYDALAHVLEHAAPDEVVIALEADEYPYLQSIIASSEKNGVKMSLIPFYNKYMPSRPSIDEVGDVSLVNLRHIPLDNIGNAFLKRAVDIVGSLAADRVHIAPLCCSQRLVLSCPRQARSCSSRNVWD